MPVVQRRIREKEVRRRQILDAAREIFFEKGFEKTTVDDIAQATELSKGAIYLYFPSKEEIYICLMTEGAAILYNMLKKAVDVDLPADTLLRRLGHSYYSFYRDYPNYFRMMFLYYSSQEIHSKVTKDLNCKCEEQAKKSLMLVAEVVQKGVDDHLFKACNPWDYALMTWAGINGIILLGEKREPENLNLHTSIERLHDVFLESTIVALKHGR